MAVSSGVGPVDFLERDFVHFVLHGGSYWYCNHTDLPGLEHPPCDPLGMRYNVPTAQLQVGRTKFCCVSPMNQGQNVFFSAVFISFPMKTLRFRRRSMAVTKRQPEQRACSARWRITPSGGGLPRS